MSQILFDFESPNVITYNKLDSSSLEIKKLIKEGEASNGLIVWAKEQTDGSGRYGKNWDSSGKGNLTFSFMVENDRTPELVAIYPFIAALAIKDAMNVFLTKEQ